MMHLVSECTRGVNPKVYKTQCLMTDKDRLFVGCHSYELGGQSGNGGKSVFIRDLAGWFWVERLFYNGVKSLMPAYIFSRRPKKRLLQKVTP